MCAIVVGRLAGFGTSILKTASGPPCQATPFMSYSNKFLVLVFSLYPLQAAFPFCLQTHLFLPSMAMLARPAQTLEVCVVVATLRCLPMRGITMYLISSCTRSNLTCFILFRDCFSEIFIPPYTLVVSQQSQKQLARQGQLAKYLAILKHHSKELMYTSIVGHGCINAADNCRETLRRLSWSHYSRKAHRNSQ